MCKETETQKHMIIINMYSHNQIWYTRVERLVISRVQ